MGPLATVLGTLLSAVRRRVVDENLDLALGPAEPAARRRMVRRIGRNAILTLLESARLQRMTPEQIAGAVQIDPAELERVLAMLRDSRGTILATGHFGNWEWSAAWIPAIHPAAAVGVVYKPLHNPLVDAYVHRQRERLRLRLFSTRDRTQRALVAWLRRGGNAGILSDQDARRHGEFIPFFGRPASTATGMGDLAARMDLNVLFCFLQRIEPCRFRMRTFAPRPPAAGLDRAAAGRWLMAEYHRALEQVIRDAPEQYFWWHRRWKSQPRDSNAAGPPAAG
jgi:KDO2-lipid IV(A) lauroyltransferase